MRAYPFTLVLAMVATGCVPPPDEVGDGSLEPAPGLESESPSKAAPTADEVRTAIPLLDWKKHGWPAHKAAAALIERAGTTAIEPVVEYAAEHDDTPAWQGIKLLAKLGREGDAARPALRRLAVSAPRMTAMQACKTLGVVGTVEDLPALSLALERPGLNLSGYAAYAIGRLGRGSVHAADILVAHLEAANRKNNYVYPLACVGPVAGARALPVLTEMVRRRDPYVTGKVVATLIRIERFEDTLLEDIVAVLPKLRWQERATLFHWLARNGSPRANEVVTQAIFDEQKLNGYPVKVARQELHRLDQSRADVRRAREFLLRSDWWMDVGYALTALQGRSELIAAHAGELAEALGRGSLTLTDKVLKLLESGQRVPPAVVPALRKVVETGYSSQKARARAVLARLAEAPGTVPAAGASHQASVGK